MNNSYDFKEIEKKWQEYWLENNSFEPSQDYSKPKKYILSMFPYPSGKIHMGHVRNYSITDAMARYYRRRGFNVLHPFGWDAFGLPAENAAIKNQVHPRMWTYSNIDSMNDEFKKLGLSFAWNYECITADPIYTRWEQFIFLKMFEKGLIYRKEASLNYCEVDKTVLANEQVINNLCWRCDTPVVQKQMNQYYLKITDYAEELLQDLNQLEGHWPQQVITMQRNWIGKKEGYEFKLSVHTGDNQTFDVSIFEDDIAQISNTQYLALNVNSPLAKHLRTNDSQIEASAQKIISNINSKVFNEKLCIKTNLKVFVPFLNKEVPVLITDFASINPELDALLVSNVKERDVDFLSSNNLQIDPKINDNLKLNISKTVKYNLRDWGLSRQRYWGTPIPLVHCPHCGIVAEKESHLPILLPEKVVFDGKGNPLKTNENWLKVKCPQCGEPAMRETDTLDTFFESSWYFLRYTTPPHLRESQIFDETSINYWNEVDEYVGGIEHAILHLLYARFFTKVLADLNLVNFREPFKNLLTQGMVLKDGSKMSKSKGNTVEPSELISQYGADASRLFIFFAAPPTKELDWNDSGVNGCFKFIKKIYEKALLVNNNDDLTKIKELNLNSLEKIARRKLYLGLEKTFETFENRKNEFSFNTVVSWCMETLNAYDEVENSLLIKELLYVILNILEPFAPHVAWELSKELFDLKNLFDFSIDESALVVDEISLGVTVNGKARGEITVAKNESKDKILELAKLEVSKWLEEQEIVKEILVPNKLVNFVIKPKK
ncbi:leucine--tRNA ligase [Mycoplasmopsis pullorum]|uniref:class I tRNA ligase family protein n=1 Tax=Mycoplasmopsis pullorum TaxID=48003 RepID=UPI0011196D2C|nr:class I tRNA ligase family protein [Mycoplasmopsis pullorum]TNK83996.1 leucine--tRNA ligase [Mycoplasmopsis pullorum]TNK92257.1 leucine--tRNA ligase [Mycoplasmopsis pullorum]